MVSTRGQPDVNQPAPPYRDEAAPEGDVDVELAPRRLELHVEGRAVGRRGEAVQRHVDHGGDAARRRRLGSCLESLPRLTLGMRNWL